MLIFHVSSFLTNTMKTEQCGKVLDGFETRFNANYSQFSVQCGEIIDGFETSFSANYSHQGKFLNLSTTL